MLRRLHSLKRTRLRWLLGLLLCLATPTAQELLFDVVAAVSDAAPDDCCTDDCDESGMPCSQQCANAACGARTAVAPGEVLVSPAPIGQWLARLDEAAGTDLSGHREPPFRPPAA